MSMSKIYERRMATVVDRLTQEGYADVFSGEAEGVRAAKSGYLHRPDELEIEKIERFEGVSDPDDETLVLAVRCKTHGCRGTYITPYGKDMRSTDAILIRKIPDVRPH